MVTRAGLGVVPDLRIGNVRPRVCLKISLIRLKKPIDGGSDAVIQIRHDDVSRRIFVYVLFGLSISAHISPVSAPFSFVLDSTTTIALGPPWTSIIVPTVSQST